MGHKNPPHVTIMQDELDKRVAENDQYSMRAFALSLGLDPAYISRVLNNKQAISTTAAKQISRRLNLVEEDRVRFLESVADEKRCSSMNEMDPGLTDCSG